MFSTFLKSLLPLVVVTCAVLNYAGSLAIDSLFMKAAGILPYEMVHVYNISNGERFETYAIEASPKSSVICLNGAAAR